MTNLGEPTVSVCIPTYCGAAFLGAAIDSVLAQTYRDFELWVVDDNSPDDTRAIVASYKDPRVKYSRNGQNLGPQGNWNQCLSLANGKYFKLLPHDDLLAPDCLQTQVAILERDVDEAIALVFGARDIIDPRGRVLLTRGLGQSHASLISARALARRCVRAGTNLIGEPGSGLIRRACAKRIGPYDASLPYVVDLDYWFRALACGSAYYTATRCASFRVSSGSWSVAIGSRQYNDVVAFGIKYRQAGALGISRWDCLLGALRAKMNTIARLLFYRFLLQPG